MVKPIGVVAMLILLASGPALADVTLPIRAISDIKVTNTSKVHFELKNGTSFVGTLPNCPVMQYASQTGVDNLGLYANGARIVKDGSKITFLDLNQRTLRKRIVGSCKIDKLGDTDDYTLLAKS
jgi:hypothetical protein